MRLAYGTGRVCVLKDITRITRRVSEIEGDSVSWVGSHVIAAMPSFLCRNHTRRCLKIPVPEGVVGLPSMQLFYRLLSRDIKSRLGSGEGASEVRRPAFFRGISPALACCR
nr:putative LOV domain-containing protein [Tanacetum cinerariifolium]